MRLSSQGKALLIAFSVYFILFIGIYLSINILELDNEADFYRVSNTRGLVIGVLIPALIGIASGLAYLVNTNKNHS
ncbi:MAG: hypothetical protein QM500_19535 [Methylococcales bacterium]